MSSEEFDALPESEEVERWLINGELRERPMTKRNPDHSGATAAITILLGIWLRRQPKPRGKVFNGDAYFRVHREPPVNVGIDVAIASAELIARTPQGSKFFDGPPELAVEVLSPADKDEEINEKIQCYLDAGVKAVWIVDPFLRTVTVCRPDAQPRMFSIDQELSGEPYLPGFRAPVAEIFED